MQDGPEWWKARDAFLRASPDRSGRHHLVTSDRVVIAVRDGPMVVRDVRIEVP